MIIYIVEFSILHLLFFGIYKLMLSKETQLEFLRFFLIGSTLLSLSIPLIEIPTRTSLPVVNLEATFLPMFEVGQSTVETSLSWYEIIFYVITLLFIARFLFGIVRILHYRKNSKINTVDGIEVRELPNLETSFTFMKWIFIDTSHFENPGDIVQHELGHAKKLHSLDMLFFHLLTIPFWWLPSIWLMIKELKDVHEFEADEYALKTKNETYAKTLVHCTLKAHGMNLASSFDDAPIFNRLNFMKKMKKKISIWKVASIATLVAISGAMFACEEYLENNEMVALNYSQETQQFLEIIRNEYPNDKFTVVVDRLPYGSKIDDLEKYKELYTVYTMVAETVDSKFRNVEMVQSEKKSTTYDMKTIKRLISEIKYEKTKDESVETVVEVSASFPGGIEAFYEYISKNLKYPVQASRLGVEGRVFIQFIVEEDGSISSIEVVKGIGAGCDAEALRVLTNSPKWIPAKVNGKTIRQKLIQNIAFKLPS
ncbi:TonB family protein [Ekhidna sp.]|uniref:TonB family protein n=1 Tax=Ekhidna sp. TaxID=2608089 RepID=UPI003B510EF6